MEITLDNYKGTKLEKAFFNTFTELQKTDNFEKGVKDELVEDSEEMKKGCGKKTDLSNGEDSIDIGIIKATEAELLKSDVSEAFQYTGDTKFKKTGQEILDSVEIKGVKYQSKLADIATKMAGLRDLIDEDPTEVANVSEETLDMCPFAELRYSWNKCNNLEVAQQSTGYGNLIQAGEKAGLCEQYNSLINKLDGVCQDLVALKVLKESINPKENYFLTFKQVKSLFV